MEKKLTGITLAILVLIIALILTALTVSACGKSGRGGKSGPDKKQSSSGKSGKRVISVKIGRKDFKAKLYNTRAAKKLYKKLPLKIRMEDLNKNEKYKYLSFRLPRKERKVRKIKAGDIMLYEDNCLVIFYKSFKTPYEYTKIGRITNRRGLKRAAGRGKVTVKFSR